nr:DUF397 domain-containing protein [Nocardiopsis flavescens]
MLWHESGHSGVNGTRVEVADLPGGAAVRDSEHSADGRLPFFPPEWTAFLQPARG